MGASRARLAITAWALALLLLAALPLAPRQAWANDDLKAGDAAGLQAQATVASGTAGTCPWELDSDGTLTVRPGDYRTIDAGGYGNDVKRVVFKAEGGKKVVLGRRPGLGLGNFPNMASLDPSGLDTSNVTDMGSMFSGCSSLKSLDLSGFDTSNVTRMNGMFRKCSSLASLDLSGFSASKVTRMDGMFRGCTSLESLNVTGWDTSNATSMYNMFRKCSSLASLDLSGFSASKVTRMDGMFRGCSSLESLDLFRPDTSNVTRMNGMFRGCSSLKSLDLSGLDTSNVTTTTSMLEGCAALASVNLAGLDTRSLASMDKMFSGCGSLRSLDLSGFSLKSNMAPDSLFFGCLSLQELNLPRDLNPGYLPGAWRGPGGVEIADYAFASEYDPAAMFGKWARVVDMSTLAVDFADPGFAEAAHAYTGRPYRPAVKVEGSDGAYEQGRDYEVSYKSNVDAGTATVSVTGVGALSGTRELSFAISKAPQKISARDCKASAKAKRSGKSKTLAKGVVVDLGKKAKVSAETTVKFAKVGKTGGKRIAVNKKTGKVTLKKGLKAGTYEVRVKLTAAANRNYEAAKAKTVTLTVRVK